MNRAQLRKLFGKPKPHKRDWTCPNCSFFYPIIWAQSKAEPYYFCKDSCTEFFDADDNNVTEIVYPDGKPWGGV